jgi:hypothetical protein
MRQLIKLSVVLSASLVVLWACSEKPLLTPEQYYTDRLPDGKTYNDVDVFENPKSWADFYKVPTDSVKIPNNLGYFKWFIAERTANYYVTPRYSLNVEILKRKMLEYAIEDGKPVDKSKFVIGWQSQGCDDTIKEFAITYSMIKNLTGTFYYYPVSFIGQNGVNNCNLYHKPCDIFKNNFYYFQNTDGANAVNNRKFERINDLLPIGVIAKKCN